MVRILGHHSDYESPVEELYAELIYKIKDKIDEIDEEFKNGELDFDGREKRYFAMMILKELLER